MRTSKISQETTRMFNALSPNARSGRATRSAAKGLATFALGYDGTVEVNQEQHAGTLDSTPSAVSDIEDVGSPTASSRKRKRGQNAATQVKTTAIKTEQQTTWSSPRKRQQIRKRDEEEDEELPDTLDTTHSPRNSQPKLPAKRSTSPGGTVHYKPPSNWDKIYNTVKAYRTANPVAPVDTMGCEDLFWHAAPPKQQRYHTLTALMLSSQTKDTVTAAAMQRLHTELVPDPPTDPSTGKIPQSSLTIENVLSCDPVHLDNLIGKVGFHNTKTKHMKLAARILHDQYGNDIPDNIEGLISLPGVGPKMAYLAMSAAWKIDVGIGVDVHVHRITNLWGWHNTKGPEETRMWLEGWLPRDRWHEINKLLVGLGQTVCLPIGRRCGECPLGGRGLCKGEVRGWVGKEEKKRKKVKVKAGEGGKAEVEVEVEREEAVIKDDDRGGLLRERRVDVKREEAG